MGDLNDAGGEDVWAKLLTFGKDIWMTELDRRGGSSAHPVNNHPLDQPGYLDHEIALLANLSAQAPGNPLKAIFVYELCKDRPGRFNPPSLTPSTASGAFSYRKPSSQNMKTTRVFIAISL